MVRPLLSPTALRWWSLALGMVWVFHGLYSKLLGGIPRHRQIVERILGADWAEPATLSIGLGEILLGLWIFTGRARLLCATVQTVAIVAMNTLEVTLARDLLLSPAGMLLLNALFLSAVWQWARARVFPQTSPR